MPGRSRPPLAWARNMARRRKPLPDSVAALDEYDKGYSGLGTGAYVLGAPESPAKEDVASLTRAQRHSLSSRARRSIGLREKAGRPGGWGPSDYKLDGVFVERVIRLLVAHDSLAVETATHKVRLALFDEPHFNEKQWLQNGWLADGTAVPSPIAGAEPAVPPKVKHPLEADVERIAGKVRAALVGDQQFANAKERQRAIDAELARLRRIWQQLQQVAGSSD